MRAPFGIPSLALLLALSACGCPGSNTPDPGPSTPPPPPDLEVDRVPMKETPVDALQTDQLSHTQLLRIERDFGKAHFQIALDAWVTKRQPRQLADTRLWWTRSDRQWTRSPFGPNTRRHFQIEYAQPSETRWDVHLLSDDKRFTFHIELDGDGQPAAFADVVTARGRIEHCRAHTGTLVGRKVLGLVVGIERLDVSCTDDGGTKHSGHVDAGTG